jgi:hypothetical protein
LVRGWNHIWIRYTLTAFVVIRSLTSNIAARSVLAERNTSKGRQLLAVNAADKRKTKMM